MARRFTPLALVAAVGLTLGIVAPAGQVAGARPVSAWPVPDVATACPVTPYVEAALDDKFTTTWYGGGHLWAGLDLATRGRWYAAPEFNKVQWRRPAGQPLSVEGRRLDAPAPPLAVDIPDGYPGDFQVSALTFPEAGCWEVVGRIPGRELRFVVLVHPGDEYGNAPPLPPGVWEDLARPFASPALAAGEPCLRTPGRAVARVEGVVLGHGPVYAQGLGDDGLVPLGEATDSGAVPPVPIRWIVDPTYPGPLLIRGRRLDDSEPLGFGRDEPLPAVEVWTESELTTPDWRVWHRYPEDVRLPGPGCYALQVDGLDFTRVIVFEAVPGPRPAPQRAWPDG